MKLISILVFASALFAQTTRYPAALDSDSSLFVVSDNIQSTLSVAMQPADTALIVQSGTGFLPNMIASICDASTSTGKCTSLEHMLVTAVNGNIITVTRGFAGTTAVSHASGKLVSALIDAAHQKVLKDAVIAIEATLGPNLANISSSGPIMNAAAFNFSPYSCNVSSVCIPGGGSGMGLVSGNNPLTMTPVPLGVTGTDTDHFLYVSGGSGAAEPCLISGGGGTGGSPSGTIIINCGHSHTGAWVISSATAGQAEAISVSGGNVQVIALPSPSTPVSDIAMQPSNITMLDLTKRTASNTSSYMTVRKNLDAPEITNRNILPPPFTQTMNAAFASGTQISAGSPTLEDDAILATCDNSGGGWPATQNGCVAFKGVAIAHALNSPTWAANFVIGNQPGIDSPLTGMEIDIGNYVADLGSGARKNGIQISDGGTAAAGDAIVINSLSGGPGWNYGILMEGSTLSVGGIGLRVNAQTNAAAAGIDLLGSFTYGAIHIGGVGQPIRLATTSSTDAFISTNGNNFEFLQPATGAIQFANNAATPLWQIPASSLNLVSTGEVFASLGSATAGAMVWCTNCAVATPCTGAGSGAWAFANGTRWACPF